MSGAGTPRSGYSQTNRRSLSPAQSQKSSGSYRKSRDGDRRRDPDDLKDRPRERDRYKDHDYDRRDSRDYSSRGDREVDRDRDRDRDRERSDRRYDDRNYRRDNNRPPPPRRRSRSPYAPPPRRYRPPTPPPVDPKTELDREQRSVFCQDLSARVKEKDLIAFFDDSLGQGSVLEARLVTDRNTGRSKGYAYVELRSLQHVTSAMSLTGQTLLGLPIMIKLSESDRNHVGNAANLPVGFKTSTVGTGATGDTTGSVLNGNSSIPYNRLFVASLPVDLSRSDIMQIFEAIGPLENVDLHVDANTGRSRGTAFIQYKAIEDAQNALDQMNNFIIQDRPIRVSLPLNNGNRSQNEFSSSLSYNDTRSGASYSGISSGTLDDGGGHVSSAAGRQSLMQMLSRSHGVVTTPTVPQNSSLLRRHNIPEAQTKSVLLSNMFDPSTETDVDWDKELADDVKLECERQYGPIRGISVDNGSKGDIYLAFASQEGATKAVAGLNGRFFGGRQAHAKYISDVLMDAHLN